MKRNKKKQGTNIEIPDSGARMVDFIRDFLQRGLKTVKYDESVVIYLMRDLVRHKVNSPHIMPKNESISFFDLIFVEGEDRSKDFPYVFGDIFWFYRVVSENWVHSIYDRTRSAILASIALEITIKLAGWIWEHYGYRFKTENSFKYTLYDVDKRFKGDVTGMVGDSYISYFVSNGVYLNHWHGHISPFFTVEYEGVAQIRRCCESESFTEHELFLHYYGEKDIDGGDLMPCGVLMYSNNMHRPFEGNDSQNYYLYKKFINIPFKWITGEYELKMDEIYYFFLPRLVTDDLLNNLDKIFVKLNDEEIPFLLSYRDRDIDCSQCSEEERLSVMCNALPQPIPTHSGRSPSHLYPNISKRIL